MVLSMNSLVLVVVVLLLLVQLVLMRWLEI